MTNRPAVLLVERDPPHFAHSESGVRIVEEIESRLSACSAGLGVVVELTSRVSCSDSTESLGLSGEYSVLPLPKMPTWRAGGLKGRGEDGDEASVVMSDISDINSGVDGAQERRGDDRLEVLATLRSAGEPRDRLESGIRDPSRGLPTGELL